MSRNHHGRFPEELTNGSHDIGVRLEKINVEKIFDSETSFPIAARDELLSPGTLLM